MLYIVYTSNNSKVVTFSMTNVVLSIAISNVKLCVEFCALHEMVWERINPFCCMIATGNSWSVMDVFVTPITVMFTKPVGSNERRIRKMITVVCRIYLVGKVQRKI